MIYSNKSQFQKDFKSYFMKEIKSNSSFDINELFSHMNLVFVQNELSRVSICHYALSHDHIAALLYCINSQNGKCIKELVLNSCCIDDQMSSTIAKQLRKNKYIQSIELFGNFINDQSLIDWAQFIKSNNSLLRLKLGDNKISEYGIHILSEAIALNCSIVQLHLGGNSIGDEGIIHLCNVIPERNKTIISLALRENNITEKGMKYIGDMLKHNDCMISDIQLKGNAMIGQEGAKKLAPALAVNKSLKVLELHGANIGAEGATACCHSMIHNTSIHAINFNQNDIGDSGAISVANLLQMGRISTLGLSENNITYKGVTALSHAFNFSNLTGIDLGGNSNIGNSGAIEISKALRSNISITSIDLRGCGIGIKGCIALAEMIKENKCLQHLDLGGNSCKNDGAEAFSEALRINTTLKRLCLTDNMIMNRGGISLSYGLQNNLSLINLAFGGQGEKQNKISTPLRNIIDSIIKENKKIAKEFENELLEGITDSIKKQLLQKSSNINRRIDPQEVLNKYKESRKIGELNWIHNSESNQLSEIELQSKLENLFKFDLIEKRDLKYPSYVYLEDVATSLYEYFPETRGRISHQQLLKFLYKNDQFYVHFTSGSNQYNCGKTQIKFLNDTIKKHGKKNINIKESKKESFNFDDKENFSSFIDNQLNYPKHNLFLSNINNSRINNPKDNINTLQDSNIGEKTKNLNNSILNDLYRQPTNITELNLLNKIQGRVYSDEVVSFKNSSERMYTGYIDSQWNNFGTNLGNINWDNIQTSNEYRFPLQRLHGIGSGITHNYLQKSYIGPHNIDSQKSIHVFQDDSSVNDKISTESNEIISKKKSSINVLKEKEFHYIEKCPWESDPEDEIQEYKLFPSSKNNNS